MTNSLKIHAVQVRCALGGEIPCIDSLADVYILSKSPNPNIELKIVQLMCSFEEVFIQRPQSLT